MDSDAFAHRGVIEGYYGPPYTHAERLWLIERMGAWGMNRYIYAPKDDPLHRAEWRAPYGAAALREFAELVERGAAVGVDVGFAVSPGLTIQYGSADDVRALQAKFRSFHVLGARLFSLALDDVPTSLLHAGDEARFGSLAAAHVTLTHAVAEALGDAPLPSVLLLHHTNVQGARHEVVALEGSAVTARGDVAIAFDSPGSVAPGERFDLVLTVQNDGTVPVADVRLDASVSGAVVASVTSPLGPCSEGAAVACELGSLEPGAAVKVVIAALAPASAPAAQVTFEAAARSLAGCEASLDDNALEGAIPIVATVTLRDALAIGGGCGCRVDREGQSTGGATLGWLAALALCAARRRARAS